MRRSIYVLVAGIFLAAVFMSAVSVYVFHDADIGETGHLNAAFSGLCRESGIFALTVGLMAGLVAFLGSYVLRLRGYSPRESRAFVVGICISVVQYPCDYAVRRLFPGYADLGLSIYLILAVLVGASAMLWDCFRQKKIAQSV